MRRVMTDTGARCVKTAAEMVQWEIKIYREALQLLADGVTADGNGNSWAAGHFHGQRQAAIIATAALDRVEEGKAWNGEG